MAQEKVSLKEGDIDAEVDKMLSQFGEQAEVFRQYFDTPQQRSNIANSLLYDRLMSRLAKIGKGESLEEVEEESVEAEASVETSAEVETVEADVESATEDEVSESVVEEVPDSEAAQEEIVEEEAGSDAATDDETESE